MGGNRWSIKHDFLEVGGKGNFIAQEGGGKRLDNPLNERSSSTGKGSTAIQASRADLAVPRVRGRISLLRKARLHGEKGSGQET